MINIFVRIPIRGNCLHTRFIVCKHVAVMVMVEIMVTWYYDLLYSLSGKIPLKVISASSMGRIHNSSFGRDATCRHLMFGRCWPVARQKYSNPSHYILFTRHILPFGIFYYHHLKNLRALADLIILLSDMLLQITKLRGTRSLVTIYLLHFHPRIWKVSFLGENKGRTHWLHSSSTG